MEDVGLKCNHEITNQFGKPENVLLVRRRQPRQLQAYTFTGTLLDVDRLPQRVRKLQPEAQFAHEVNQDLEACVYKPGSKRRVPDASKVKKLVKKHLKFLKKKEAAPAANSEDDDEPEAEEEEMQFFRRGGVRSKTKAKGTNKKNTGKKVQESTKRGAGTNKKARGESGRSLGVSPGLQSDFSRLSTGAASVVPVGRRSVGNASLAEVDGGAGAVAVSSRSTVAGRGDKDGKTQFYFDFQSVLEGMVDRNALNGAIVL
jgi:hypothetical protein